MLPGRRGFIILVFTCMTLPHYKFLEGTGHQWVIPVILTTQKARDQEDHGSKPAPGKYLSQKYPTQNRAG
jgi:hypothetical protein